MKILVTGASGFIGRHTVAALRVDGHELVGLGRSSFDGVDEFRTADIGSPASIDAVRGVDCVVHLAAFFSATEAAADPYGVNMTNAVGTLHMLEGARKWGARFVFASSQRVYRPTGLALHEDEAVDPQEAYGVSKAVAESWVRLYHDRYSVPGTILRIFTAYGPGQRIASGQSGVAAIFLEAALRNEEIWVDGDQQRDLIYVEDVADAIRRAVAQSESGGCFNVGGGDPISLADLARLAVEVTGSNSKIVKHDRGGQGIRLQASTARTFEILGFRASTPIADGLAKHAGWLKDRLT